MSRRTLPRTALCLYDRALGVTYLMGLWEALEKQK